MLNIFHGIHKGPLPPLTAEETDLSARLRRHVEMLAGTIGERNVLNRPDELERAAAYVERELTDLGFAVASQPFPIRSTQFETGSRQVRNLDCEQLGAALPEEIVVVGAHYDSVLRCPGANDNASGVAATLEIARALRGRALKRTVRFVAFVNEEPPFFQTELMGSLVYARRCRERGENVVAMITPETIGCYSDERGSQSFPPPLNFLYPNVGNFIAFVGNGASAKLVSRVTGAFRRTTQFPAVGFAAPKWLTQAGWSDHWSFWKNGYAGVMATDTAPLRYRYYHTPEDTPDKVDYEKTARVVAGLTRAVIDLADGA